MSRGLNACDRDARQSLAVTPAAAACRSRRSSGRRTDVSACALACAPFSMIEQNGHAVTTVSAPVACSCLNRTSLMREPGLLFLVGEQQAAAGAAADTGCRGCAPAR